MVLNWTAVEEKGKVSILAIGVPEDLITADCMEWSHDFVLEV
jgi:hypothetical protein